MCVWGGGGGVWGCPRARARARARVRLTHVRSVILAAIRAELPAVPVVFLTGHTHYRGYAEARAYIDIVDITNSKSRSQNRHYLFIYYHHHHYFPTVLFSISISSRSHHAHYGGYAGARTMIWLSLYFPHYFCTTIIVFVSFLSARTIAAMRRWRYYYYFLDIITSAPRIPP